MSTIKTLSRKYLKNANFIFLFLAFFAISIGLWGNFRQLWLVENGFDAAEIAKTVSYASVLAALYLLYYTKVVSIHQIRKGVIVTVLLKVIADICLLSLSFHPQVVWIKFFFFIDIACENIVLSSIYPFMISYQKEESLYGKKSALQYTFKTMGILIGSFLLGKTVFQQVVTYNHFLVISLFFLCISFFLLLMMNPKEKEIIQYSPVKVKLTAYLKTRRLPKTFLVYSFFAQTSYAIAAGLLMLILTEYANFSVSWATKYILIFSVFASIFGQLALKQFRFQNDYINFSIKIFGRFCFFILVFLINQKWVLMIAISYLLTTSSAYDYIPSELILNRLDASYLLDFTVVKYIFDLIGEAVGIFLAGMVFGFGFRYIYLLASLVIVVQLLIGYYLIFQSKKGNSTKI